MGTPLGPKYKPYTYMDPLGLFSKHRARQTAQTVAIIKNMSGVAPNVMDAGAASRKFFAHPTERTALVSGGGACGRALTAALALALSASDEGIASCTGAEGRHCPKP